MHVSHPKRKNWKDCNSLILEYYVEDTLGQSEWEFNFVENKNSNFPVVKLGPYTGDSSSSTKINYHNQIFIPVASDGTFYLKWTATGSSHISLSRLRILGWI